jgi:predicted dehydrogenase
MVRIGIVGIGFMGRIHYLAARRVSGAAVTAVCSRDPAKRAGDWAATRGNFGPPPGLVDLTGVRPHARLADLLADPDVDLVDVCNPTAEHPATAVAALEAGKHVLVEKPIALTPADADRMVAAAAANGRLLMVAHVLPFFPEFRFAAEAIRSGRHGKLLAAHFTRVISRPDWSAAIGDVAATGGPALDLHVHDAHFVGYACGTPAAVFAHGRTDGDAVTYLTTSYLYGPGGPAVTCSSGAVAAAGRPFAHGFEVYLERATLSYGPHPLTVYPANGPAETPALGGGDPLDAFADEIAAAVRGVESGAEPELLSGRLAADAVRLCHAEVESVRTGRVVQIAQIA